MKSKKTIGQKKILAASMPKSAEFWAKELEQAIPSTYPTDFYRASETTADENLIRASVKITSGLCEKLTAVCGTENELSEMFAASVYSLLYMTYNGVAQDFLVNYSTVSSKQDLQVPLRLQVEDDSTYFSFLNAVREGVNRAQEHKNYPVDLLVPSYNLEINVIHFKEEQTPIQSGESLLSIDFVQEKADGDFLLTVTGDASRYLEASIQDLCNKILLLLETCAVSPQSPLLQIDLRSTYDRNFSEALNATEHPFSHEASLVDLFDKTFEAWATENAILGTDRTVTFAELDRMSKQIADFLSEVSDPADAVIGILVDRSVDFLAGVLGIMRAGKAYLPLDAKAPEERNSRILNQSGAKIVLCSDMYSNHVPQPIKSYALESIQPSEENKLLPQVTPESLAYVIFTSGSTGLPKGVCVNHRSAVNRIEWMQKSFPLQQDDVILHKTPSTFDVSVWELFWWLTTGSKVALLPPNQEANPETILETIERNAVTTMHFVPSMLNAFLDYVESTGSASRLKSLRRVFCSGEALSPHHVQKFYALLDHVLLVNLYGPTEATVDVTCHITEKGDNPVPIGKPIDNIRLYIVDDSHKERPVGMVGELCIAGVGVSNGYINDEARTAERFLPMPSLGEEIVYMTGDLARLRHDGTIEYMGRNDRQVKVRGFRIELGEIEHALTNRSYINDAIVLSHGESDGMSHLYAFVILADKTITDTTIVEDLARVVPKYMIPDKVILVESMPLTPNGKVDKGALLSLRDQRESHEKELPTSNEEKLMAEIWQNVLGIEEVGVTDNFFALGGNSINFVSVLAMANEKGMNLSFQQLFKHPIIRDLLNSTRETESDQDLMREISNFDLITEEDRSKIPDGIEDAYPMSLLQAGLVYQCIVMQGDNNYHDVVSYLIQGELQVEVFEEAVRSLVKKQPIFRTSYNLVDFSQYMQLVHKEPEHLPLNVYDIRGLKTQEEQDQWYEDWLWKEQHRPFDYESPGLVQLHIHILRDDLYRYSISQHNSALDGWSMNKVHAYLFQTYFDMINGSNDRNAIISSNDYNRTFIHLEQQAIKSEKQRKFWGDLLVNAPKGEIPRARETKQKHGNDVVFYDVAISDGLSEKIVQLANDLKVPVKEILLASHLKFLSLLTKNDDVLTGYEIGGRPEKLGAEDALGVFLNTMPFRVTLNPQETWGEFIRSVYDLEAKVLPFRRYPMQKVKQDLGDRNDLLFDTVFNFTHFYSLKGIRDLPGMDLLNVRAAAITEFPIRAEYSRHFYTDKVQLSLHYHTALFDEDDMKDFGKVFIQILESMVGRTDERHKELSAGEYLDRFTLYPSEKAVANTNDGELKQAEIVHPMDQGKFLEAVDRVKEAWSSVLDKPKSELNLDDDFYNIGGSSLTAMKVALMMEKQLSLKTIMQKPILHELALELMNQNTKPVEQTNLLQCLSKSQLSDLNIIFIPYAGGNALNFMPIAKAFEAIDADVSVHAVELPGHDPNSASSKLMDFASVAKKIADEIVVKMGNAEFVIWGHCVGTALAFEVTRQLEERSRAPKKLFLAAKVMYQPDEIVETLESAKKLVFADIAKLHAEWSGTNELSTLGEAYERHLAKSFQHDSIEANKYMLSLWSKIGEISLQTPTVSVVTEDDPATATYADVWNQWSHWVPNLKLQVFDQGGHYFFRTIQSKLAEFLLAETDSKSKSISTR